MRTFKDFWDFILYNSGSTSLTVGDIISLIAGIIVLYFLIFRLFRRILNKVIERFSADQKLNIRFISNIFSYLLFIIGIIIIMQTSGIEMSALSLFGGALGVGIGFGLQNITNNLISGVIIFFEKPIKVGDRVQVGDLLGDVQQISIRSTAILTNDNYSVIVPNSYFIDNNVINWSHNNRRIRIQVPLGVSYKEDPLKVKELLLGVAKDHEDVLRFPPADVYFDNFGDSSLNFTLIVWTEKYITRPRVLKSKLYYEIFSKFAENKVEIPFPQRDINLRDTWLKNYFGSHSLKFGEESE